MKRILATALLATTAISMPAHAREVRDVMGSILADAHEAAQLNAKCDSYVEAITERRALLTDAAAPTLHNTLVPLDEVSALINAGQGEFSLYEQVMATPELREAGGACVARLFSIASQVNLSRPIYDRIVALDVSAEDPLTQSYVADIRANFERAGVALDETQRARVQEIQDELGQISQVLSRNIAEGVRSITARPDELEGLPQDFIDAHQPNEDGLITLTTAYTDYQPVMTYAVSDDLRRRFSAVYGLRAYPENDEPMRRMFTLRAELAQILGRENYATLILEDKMLDTTAAVEDLIAQAHAAALPAAERDYARNLEVLQQIDPAATRIEYWQSGFVSTRAQQALYDYDRQEARRYFAYDNVRDGVLQLTEDLFGVEIRPWDTPVWNDAVEAYEMVDDGQVIGRFYFDNHPRPGKYTHANMIPIYPGVPGEDVPVGALVQNLPAGDHATGLMEHGQVETLLHEFGHMIHGMFGGTQRWFGQNFLTIEWDVVEAPSQMLENWVYDYDTLAGFAVDAEGQTIPRDLVEKMNRVRYFNNGLGELRQLGLTEVSLRFHTDPLPDDLGEATRGWRNRYELITIPDGDQMQAAFNHLDGYSAFYYTYLWSRVVGADLFTRFESEGIRNPQTAADYRAMILAPGGTRPARELIHDFLGRDVTIDAYRAQLEHGAE